MDGKQREMDSKEMEEWKGARRASAYLLVSRMGRSEMDHFSQLQWRWI